MDKFSRIRRLIEQYLAIVIESNDIIGYLDSLKMLTYFVHLVLAAMMLHRC